MKSCNLTFHYYWGGVFIALPLFLKVGMNLATPRYPQDFFFFFATSLSLILFGFYKPVDLKIKLIAGGFFALAFLNSFNFTSMMYVYQIILISTFCLALVQFNSQSLTDIDKKLSILFNGIGVSAIIQVILGILQKFGHNPHQLLYFFLELGGKQKYISVGSTGTLNNQNIFGCFLALALPVFFRKKWCYFIPFILLGIYLSASTGPLLAIVGCVVGYTLHKKVQKLYYLAPLLGLVFTYCVYVSPLSEQKFPRKTIWRNMIDKTKSEHYLKGYGTAFVTENKKSWKGRYVYPADQAHNEYLELFITYGAAGVILVTAYFYLFYNTVSPILSAITAGSLVSSLFHFNLHISITALMFLVSISYNYKKKQGVDHH